jgi:hypothetical protein
MCEGAPFGLDGRRTGHSFTSGGNGHGRCECGAFSPTELPSANQRKAWHRHHKLEVLLPTTP